MTENTEAVAAREAARNTTNGQFGEQRKTDSGTAVLPDPAPEPVIVDTILTGTCPDCFTDEVVDRLTAEYEDARGIDVWRLAEQLSTVRTKRLADLAAHHYPGCATIVLEPDSDGNDNVTIADLRSADGSSIDYDWDDRFDQLVDEARDIYFRNRQWREIAATEDDSYWYVDVAGAQSIVPAF